MQLECDVQELNRTPKLREAAYLSSRMRHLAQRQQEACLSCRCRPHHVEAGHIIKLCCSCFPRLLTSQGMDAHLPSIAVHASLKNEWQCNTPPLKGRTHP
eukprot:209601-Pelagomonas_calceolata.AAC.5